MKLDQTKCDHCGKLHDNAAVEQFEVFLSVLLDVDGETKYFDFCGENCLREELIKRNAESLNPAR